jgi:Heterokaryon incompatibility protein (HET)
LFTTPRPLHSAKKLKIDSTLLYYHLPAEGIRLESIANPERISSSRAEPELMPLLQVQAVPAGDKAVAKMPQSSGAADVINTSNDGSQQDIGPTTNSKNDFYASVPLSGSSTAIRVFVVENIGNTADNAPIRGHFDVVDLRHQPYFAALSYTWGTFSDTKYSVLCNNFPIEVTKNCWSALWHLRKMVKPLVIWIDAICINQEDKEEKGGQIPLMGRIYSSAEVVYIWLGEGDMRTDGVMDYLGRGTLPLRSSQISEVDSDLLTKPSLSWRVAMDLYVRAQIYQSTNAPHYSGLQEVMGRPWITRLWTLQEVVLATNATIVCGEKMISWESMVFSMNCLEYFRTHKPYEAMYL